MIGKRLQDFAGCGALLFMVGLRWPVGSDWTRGHNNDARDKKMGRPEDEDDVLTEWRGFVQQAGMADAGLVGTLPRVGSGLRASQDVETT